MASAATAAADDRALLLRIVDESYDKPTFNDTNLRSTLRRVTAAEAAWRPRGAKYNIAEIVVHCAYWKYAIRRRLTGEPPRSFPVKGSNWFAVPNRLTGAQWSEYVRLLDDEHRKLRTAVREVDRALAYGSSSGRNAVRWVFGIAAHDAYHTGQIHLLRAMHKRRRS